MKIIRPTTLVAAVLAALLLLIGQTIEAQRGSNAGVATSKAARAP
jgi:hypothetical protein